MEIPSYTSPAFRGEVGDGDINLRIIGLEMVFKTIRLDKLTSLDIINKEKIED